MTTTLCQELACWLCIDFEIDIDSSRLADAIIQMIYQVWHRWLNFVVDDLIEGETMTSDMAFLALVKIPLKGLNLKVFDQEQPKAITKPAMMFRFNCV